MQQQMLGLGDPHRERRLMIARLLANQDHSPTAGPVGAVAKAGTQMLQALIAKQLMGQDEQEEAVASDVMQSAGRLMADQPAETQNFSDGTTINWDERKANPQLAIAKLLANPRTAGIGMQQQGRMQENEDWQNRFRMQDEAMAGRARESERAADERLKLQLDSASQDRAAQRAQAAMLADMQRQTALEVANIRAAAGKAAMTPPDPSRVGTGFAGGTATDNLYNPNDMIDRQQGRVDAQEGAKLAADARKGAEQATGLLGDVRNMQSADKTAYTGRFAGINQWGNQLLGMFGNDEAKKRAAAYETIEGGAADMARGERTPGEGAISDFDAKQFRLIVPGPEKSEAFNQRALEAREQASIVAQQKPLFLDEFRRKNGNLVGSDAAWQRYLNANPIVSENVDINDPATFLNPNRKTWQEFFGESDGVPVAAAPPPAPSSGGWSIQRVQ